jgi:serine/threonine protein kinase
MPDSRYRITERIAAGGMAEVFKGVAESLQGFRKGVAIKRVLPALTKNKKFVAMFLDEARLSLHLQHANIVQVFDIGHADETYFIVMEYVDGVDLKQMLEWRRRIGKRLTIGQTIYLMMEICKGLAYAHDVVHPETGEPLGIVHRDVSPPNVLVSRNGEVKLADFGLAKAASQIETTDPGVVKGKMSYLSPEAARGEEVDRRADIFAAGILLYEMLTGKRLFYGDSDYQTVELVRAAKIPPIAPQNPEVEGEIEEICRKALARRVEDRFQTAADLQDALAHYLFSRGLKMIQRDIGDLVRGCLEDLTTLSGTRKPKPNIIDTILHEEIDSFTSLEYDEPPKRGKSGDVVTVGDLVDPRAWAEDPDWPGRRTAGRRPTTGGNRRNTGTMPMPQPPTNGPPSSARTAATPSQNLPAAGGGHSPGSRPGDGTPGPDQLADALEPMDPPASVATHRWIGKGVLIGVLIGAAAVGALFAALLARH